MALISPANDVHVTRILPTLAAMSLVGVGAAPASAADQERREFTILIDGKSSGTYHMTIRRQDDGSVVMSAEADVRVSYVVYTYKYSYHGSEVWKDGRLRRLESTSHDGGRRSAVTAMAEGPKLRVRANGRERLIRPDVWTTTYWHLPDESRRNRPLALLDADTARDIQGTLRRVGTERLKVAGQTRDCPHYRLTGDVRVDLWYDDEDRLVRQESVEDGHRTVLELAAMHHPPGH